jgi:hypothetical protein
MPETIDGKTLTANTVTEAKLVSAFTDKVANAYAQANAAYAQANSPLSGSNVVGNLIVVAPGKLGLDITPNTLLHVRHQVWDLLSTLMFSLSQSYTSLVHQLQTARLTFAQILQLPWIHFYERVKQSH